MGTGGATPHRDSSSEDLAESEDSSASEEEYETYAQVCRKGKRPRRRANLTINKGQGAEKQQPQAKRRRADPLTDSWADRMESDVEDPMDYSKEVTWDDETPKLREVSEKTNTLLTKACTSRLSTAMRLSHRSSHLSPRSQPLGLPSWIR